MTENKTRDHAGFNKGLLLGPIIMAVALIAALLWLGDTMNENAELKNYLKKREVIIAKQWEVINQNNKEIDALKNNVGNLQIILAKSNREKEKLSRENGFLFLWGNTVTDKLESTIDYRPLTIMKCNNIADWLFKKAKEFREFYEGR